MVIVWFLLSSAQAGVLDVIDSVAPFRHLRMADGAPEIPRDAYERAAQGKPQAGLEYVAGKKAGKAWGVSIVDVDVELLWMAVNGVEDQDVHFDGVGVSTVLEGDQRRTGRNLFQLAPIPLAADRWWVVHQRHNAAMYTASSGRLWEQASKSVDDPALPDRVSEAVNSGIPVIWAESAWLLIPLQQGRTVIEYYTWNDPGGYVPVSLASRLAPGAVKRYMSDLEAYGRTLPETSREGYVKPDQSEF